MPINRIDLTPGVNREGTNYSNKGGFFVSEKVRFRGGFAQKIGGWQNVTSSGETYSGVARSLWNYITLASYNFLVVATNQKVYVEMGGAYHDITPLRTTVTLAGNPINTTSGSRLVEVTHASHGATLWSYVTFSGASAVGGITLSGEFEIVSSPSTSTYFVIAASAASSTANGGGSSVSAAYNINSAPATETQVSGWGSPPWSFGGWGSATAVGSPMRLWSIVNYEDDVIFAERDGGIYYWTDDTTTWSRSVAFVEKINSLTKANVYATFASGVTTVLLDDVSNITTGSTLAGSGLPTSAYVTTAWTGGLSVTISAATTASLTLSAATASYAGPHAPNETMVLELSPVQNFLMAMGSKPYNPTSFSTTYDPLLVRWSDEDNPYEWVPSSLNQAGELRLSNGSHIVASSRARSETLVFTNTALYGMQYVGPPFVWSTTLLDQNISIASQNAVVAANNAVFWMGEDKFYVYDGGVKVLACSVARYVYDTLERSQISQVMSGFNEAFNEVWWFYPGTGSNVCSIYVAFNFLENTWHYGTLNRTAYASQTLRSYPMISNGVQVSYLSAAINSTDTTITLLNGTSYPPSGTVAIDSEEISYTAASGNTLSGCTRGVNSTIAASHAIYSLAPMRAENQVLFHDIGLDNVETGSPEAFEAYIETSDFDIGDGDKFSFISKIIPDIKFTGSTANSPSVALALYPRTQSGAAYGTNSSGNVIASSVYPVDVYTQQLDTRIRGRQVYLKVSSTGLGVAWQIGVMRIEIRPDGRR